MEKTKIAVLVSGGGTNLQALIDAQNSGIIKSGEIVAVISNKPDVYALTRAENAGIKGYVANKKQLSAGFEDELVRILTEVKAEIIILAGFMCILSENFTKRYPNRIINVHPALIPSFCGEGFYGLHIHEAALSSQPCAARTNSTAISVRQRTQPRFPGFPTVNEILAVDRMK